MAWNDENGASVATWAALAVLGQSNETFAESENIAMSSFPLFSELSSDQLRLQRARMVAVKLDNIFRNLDEATYERHEDEGGGRAVAINAVGDFMAKDENTVGGLAKVVDANYHFTWGETA